MLRYLRVRLAEHWHTKARPPQPFAEPCDVRVLAMHATGFNSGSLLGLIRSLSVKTLGPNVRTEVILPDARGHGASSQLGWDGSNWETPALDVLHLLWQLDYDDKYTRRPRPKLIGFGHSMGGAQVLLAQQLHKGKLETSAASSGYLSDTAGTPLFDAMVVAEPIIAPLASPSPPSGWVHSPLAKLALRRKARFESMAAARSRLFSKAPLSMWDTLSQEGYLARGLVECGMEDETSRSTEAADGHASGGSTGPPTGEGSTGPPTGEGSTGPSTGEGSTGPSTGEGSTGPSTGEGSTGPSTGEGSTGPSTGEGSTGRSTGEAGGARAARAVPSHECKWEEGGHNASAIYGMLEYKDSAWFSERSRSGESQARWGSRGEEVGTPVRLACDPELESGVFGGWHGGYDRLSSTPVGVGGVTILAGEKTDILDGFADPSSGIEPGTGVFKHLADRLRNGRGANSKPAPHGVAPAGPVSFEAVPGAGHLLVQEQPEAVANAVFEAIMRCVDPTEAGAGHRS